MALLYTSTPRLNLNTGYEALPSPERRQDLERPQDLELPLRKKSSGSTRELPQRVINNVKSVVLFIGHPHSGHSIVGSILDSHPHIVVAHELDLFNKMDAHPDWGKSQIFNAFWSMSVKATTSGLRTNSSKANKKGYSLEIADLYQGYYESYIDVIGDKRGGRMTEMLRDHPKLWKQLYDRLKSVTSVPIKIFHVIRNPFDNIATSVFFVAKRNTSETFVELKQDSRIHSFDPKLIDHQTAIYFKYYEVIEDAKKRFDLDVIEVHGKDLIDDPNKVISEICDFLHVNCDDHYKSVCSSKIYPNESKTRYQLHWEDYQIKYVQSGIEKFNNLHRYIEFDS